MQAVSRIRGGRYPDGVPLGRQPHHRISPVPHLDELDNWIDHWVAVRNGRVIAAAKSSRELAYELHKLGPQADNAVTQYVRPPADGFIVGVG